VARSLQGQTDQTEKEGRLRGGALGVIGAVVISMAFMGPATAVFFNTAPMTAGAGYALAASMLLAMVTSVLVASSIAAFAKKIPAAGFAYTYNTHGFGKRGGFMSGWILAFSYGMVGPMLFSGMGAFASDFVKSQWSVNIAWWVFSLVIIAVVWAIGALGIDRSAETALIFLVLEVGVMLFLFGTILKNGGADGVTLAPFNPANSLKGLSGIGIGLLWGILNFVGFESAATLGEETRDPRRNIPIALFTAVVVIGIYFVLAAWVVAIGFGKSHTSALVADTTPWSTLANRYWGSNLSWILSVTVLNSIFANVISGSNAAVRVLFSMGREGIFARPLGRTTTAGTPLIALTAYALFSAVLCLVGGIWWGPFGAYGFYGSLLGLGMLIIYILLNLALVRFYRREHPSEFNIVRHGILPVVASLIMLLPIGGLLYPIPAYPNNWVPYVMIAWIVIGVIYLGIIVQRRPDILDAMGRAMVDEGTPSERDTRQLTSP
jgi:amino acid transporter